MSRYLVIPDVHQKVEVVEKILYKNTFDTLISLGDWFDDFNDTPEMAIRTAEYLLDLQSRFGDRFVWLLGNHDVPYVYPLLYSSHMCSGVTKEKARAITKVFDGKLDKKSIYLMYIIAQTEIPIVLSHAGLSPTVFGCPMTLKIDLLKLKEKCDRLVTDMQLGIDDPILHAGKARGGRLECGGLIWQDWNMEFSPDIDFHQIVGHTPLELFSVIRHDFSQMIPANVEHTFAEYELSKPGLNFNIDTHLEHYIIVDENKVQVHNTHEH